MLFCPIGFIVAAKILLPLANLIPLPRWRIRSPLLVSALIQSVWLLGIATHIPRHEVYPAFVWVTLDNVKYHAMLLAMCIALKLGMVFDFPLCCCCKGVARVPIEVAPPMQ